MIDNTRLISRQLAFGLAGLVFFFACAELILLTVTGKVPPHYSTVATMVIYISGFVVTPVLMFLASRNIHFKLAAIVWLHVTMGVLLLWFSEIFSPFTPLWSLMILFASIYYGWRGFIGSSSSLVVMSLVYCVLFQNELKPDPIVYSVLALMVTVMTILTSYLFVRIIMTVRTKNIDLQKAQDSEMLQVNRLNTLLNSISDAVMTLNRYGRITSQNAAAQAFFDTNESLIGRDIDQLLQLTDKVNEAVSIRSLIDLIKTTTLRDDLSTGEGGDTRHLSVQMSRIKSTFDDNEEYGVVLIIRDITKQKTLEDEKDEFISVTSHELRTPVTIVEGSISNLLLMQERHADENELRQAAQMAHDQTIYLAKIINDLSTLSRAERGIGDQVEKINVNDLIHDLFTKYAPEAEEKSLKLNLDADANLPKIETSKLYIEEILQNFINNAIKYTKEGSITLGAKMEPDGRVKFEVSDTGIGISKSDISKIFEKFYRSEDYRTRETGGTGLGLYVVEKLATKLGSKINVTSRLNQGSTFSFIIPVQPNKSVENTDHTKPAVT
ncbi:MAG: putative Multi-sensor signal transduction histidine kinase [Candidatus Saccharibacteria bacterium]|nr:putative Multi-sensor signal transduction histidine kinase [Candidatus Saccharibacteria bacterium]